MVAAYVAVDRKKKTAALTKAQQKKCFDSLWD